MQSFAQRSPARAFAPASRGALRAPAAVLGRPAWREARLACRAEQQQSGQVSTEAPGATSAQGPAKLRCCLWHPVDTTPVGVPHVDSAHAPCLACTQGDAPKLACERLQPQNTCNHTHACACAAAASSSSGGGPALDKELQKFTPRASGKTKNPAVKGSTLYLVGGPVKW